MSTHFAWTLAARYKAVWHAAWSMRHDLAGPRRLADEAAFLPAALSLQATPPHPAPRRAAWVLMTLISSAVAWSVIGHVDIVAIAPGRLMVSQRGKTIQPLEPGVVTAIRVRDGSHVQVGDLLVELDPTAASADGRMLADQRAAAAADARRATALLGVLEKPAGDEPAPTLGDDQFSAEWADIRTRIARLQAEVRRREAEVNTHQQALAKLDATLPLARQREADFKVLQQQGFVAGHAGQDRTRERVELERDQVIQQARVAEAQAAQAEGRQALASYLAETRRALHDRNADARQKGGELEQQIAKVERRRRQTRLTAPVAGTVQQLAVYTEGGVVTEAQALMVIVPDDADVTAEVMLDNKDIGFVHTGQTAEVKLETFSFTRYGTVTATVQRVSADAVIDDKRGAVFPATLRLSQLNLLVDGRPVPLVPGMNVSVEIKTGQRRVIDFLLGPVKATAQESLRER